MCWWLEAIYVGSVVIFYVMPQVIMFEVHSIIFAFKLESFCLLVDKLGCYAST